MSARVQAATTPANTDAPRTARRAHHIPSLDGLRAVSILAVLLGHLAGTGGFPAAVTHVVQNGRVDIANLGVRVFFVISGYLITGLLLSEHRRTGGISLGSFYLRRTFRIFPAYLAFLAAVVLLEANGVIALHPGDLAHALTYTMNYHRDRAWYLGHLWSLSVEEQFYLLWPMLLVTLGMRRGLRAALAFVLAAPLIRIGVWFLAPGWRDLIGNTFGTTGDAIAVGCLLAGWRDRLWDDARLRRLLTSRWAVPAVFLVGVVLSTRVTPGFLLGITVVNVAIALGIERCVRRPDGALGRLLNARAVAFVGMLSYSIYLWQQLFLNRQSHAAVTQFPVNLALAAVAAVVSYYLVEQPMLRARVRVERAWLAPRRVRVPGTGTADDPVS